MEPGEGKRSSGRVIRAAGTPLNYNVLAFPASCIRKSYREAADKVAAIKKETDSDPTR